MSETSLTSFISIPEQLIQKQVKQALAEDIGHGDLTAGLIAEDTIAQARLLCRENAVICGKQWFDASFKQINSDISIDWLVNDGGKVAANDTVCLINGNARDILTAERTAINFLQTLSATATSTAVMVAQLNNPDIRLVDTRKTIPGLRLAQKYAVNCGGAFNHRFGLYDGVLIKENHIIAAGSIAAAIQSARKNVHHGLKIEVEVENLNEVKQAITAGADTLLLDNMSFETIEQAIQIKKSLKAKHLKLEVSGNINHKQLQRLGRLEIDFISSGAITKHVQAIDFSLRFI